MTTEINIDFTEANLQFQPRPAALEDLPCAEPAPREPEILAPFAHQARVTLIERCLPMKSMLLLRGDHRGERLIAEKGLLWITQSGHSEDILLGACESFEVTQKGTLLIQGLAESRLRIVAAHKSSKLSGVISAAARQITTGLLQHFL